MMRARPALLFALVAGLLLGGSVEALRAQYSTPSINDILPGAYTVDALPPASEHRGRLAFVDNLGGGQGQVASDGQYWKRVLDGMVVTVPSASQTIHALATSNIIRINMTTVTSAVVMTVATDKLYPGYKLTVIADGLLSLGGSLGVNVSGSTVAPLPILGQRWTDFESNDGKSLVVVRTGGL